MTPSDNWASYVRATAHRSAPRWHRWLGRRPTFSAGRGSPGGPCIGQRCNRRRDARNLRGTFNTVPVALHTDQHHAVELWRRCGHVNPDAQRHWFSAETRVSINRVRRWTPQYVDANTLKITLTRASRRFGRLPVYVYNLLAGGLPGRPQFGGA